MGVLCPHPNQARKGHIECNAGVSWLGLPGALAPNHAEQHQPISVLCLSPEAGPAPGLPIWPAQWAIHQGHTPSQAPLAWVQARHSSHGLALDRSSSVSGSEEASVPLSPKSQRPALDLPRRPSGIQMNGFIQQYKLSPYCVPGHRQHPTLTALRLAWEEGPQIKVQLQG